MPGTSPKARTPQPITYRDRDGHVWLAVEIAHIRVVAPAIDGPNLCLVIRFEREGEERFAHWIGGEGWRSNQALDRLFAEAKGPGDETAPGEAPPESVDVWCDAVASMGPDELHTFEERTFRAWDRASLGKLRRAIDRRWRELSPGTP